MASSVGSPASEVADLVRRYPVAGADHVTVGLPLGTDYDSVSITWKRWPLPLAAVARRGVTWAARVSKPAPWD